LNDRSPPAQLASRLADVAGRPLVCVHESAGLAEVARVLRDEDVSCAVVLEDPLRVVTERDLARAWGDGLDADTPVSAVATTAPVWATGDTHTAVGAAIMIQQGVRHLVLVDPSGKAVSVVSMRELFDVLLNAQEPAAVFACFATVLMEGRP
jgi:CBS domain-containing protein